MSRIKKSYCFASIPVSVEYMYGYSEQLFKQYETDLLPKIFISVCEADLKFEDSMYDGVFDNGYLESLAILRKLSTAFSHMGILLFHSSAILFDGRAYLYTASSGTGKSTHTALCRKVFGDRVKMINDDKPFLRFENGIWRVYGSPWNGKHGLGNNISAPLGGVAILKRGTKNCMKRITSDIALPTLFAQSYRPQKASDMQCVLDLVVNLSRNPIYELRCDMSDEAAELSLGVMSKQLGGIYNEA